jgi:AraC-like DNA-binding protein
MQIAEFLSYFIEVFVLFFSLNLLISKKGNKLLNQLLALFFIAKTAKFILFHHFVLETWKIPLFLILPIGILYFLSPAVFYLYVRAFIRDEKKLQKSDAWHLIPIAALVIFALFTARDVFVNYILGVESYRLSVNDFLTAYKFTPPRLGLIVFYFIMSWAVILKVRKGTFSNMHKKSRNWIVFLISLVTIQMIFSIPSLFTVLTFNQQSLNEQIKQMMLIGDIIFFVLIIYTIQNPVVLYGYLFVEPFQKQENNNSKLSRKVKLADKIIINSTEEDPFPQLDIITQGVHDYMKEKKPWLRADFDISQMASDLGKPVHHCSYMLNEGLKISFRDCINQYRVQYFIDEYPKKKENITLEAMSKEAGFSNRVSFNNAFKKEKGTTPTQYFSDDK